MTNISWVVRIIASEEEHHEEGIMHLDLHFNTRSAARAHKKEMQLSDDEHEMKLFKVMTDDDGLSMFTAAR